jgi:hypothetical protein
MIKQVVPYLPACPSRWLVVASPREKAPVFLDLADVTLVNREAIGFLAGVEAAGATLVKCPEYVRSWIEAEQGDA